MEPTPISVVNNETARTGMSGAELAFRPVAIGGGFVYELPDGRRVARDVMERLAKLGMVRSVFAERVNVCPKCGSGNILFREVCPHCQGAGIDQPEVIHHFRCAGVFRAELFGEGENRVCPKCRHSLRHVGVDHEYMHAEFLCAGCGRASSSVPTAGRCMECNEHFAAENSGTDDWYDYFPTDKWDDAVLGGCATVVPGDAGPTILIVDDMEDNLDLLEDILDDSTVRLLRAMSGPEAINIAESNALDLVILDVNMPEMDGFETSERLRKTRFGSEVPIIFLTAYRTSDSDLVQGLGAGANDYVNKPVDTKDLLSRVETMLRRGSSSQR